MRVDDDCALFKVGKVSGMVLFIMVDYFLGYGLVGYSIAY
jgi:hypothetical protein